MSEGVLVGFRPSTLGSPSVEVWMRGRGRAWVLSGKREALKAGE